MDCRDLLRVELTEHFLHGTHDGHQFLQLPDLLDGECDAPLHLDSQVVERLLWVVCCLEKHLQHDDICPPKHFSILYKNLL